MQRDLEDWPPSQAFSIAVRNISTQIINITFITYIINCTVYVCMYVFMYVCVYVYVYVCVYTRYTLNNYVARI